MSLRSRCCWQWHTTPEGGWWFEFGAHIEPGYLTIWLGPGSWSYCWRWQVETQ